MSSSSTAMYPPPQMQPPPQYQGYLGYPNTYSSSHPPSFNHIGSGYGQVPSSAQSQHPGQQHQPASQQQSYAYDTSSNGLKRHSDEALQSVDLYSKRPRPDSAGTVAFYPQRPGERLCSFYMTTRTCSFGVTCRFDHPAWVPFGGIPNWKEVTASGSAPSGTESATLPQRPGEPNCSFYIKRGDCKYGQRCKFNHPKDRRASSSDSAASSKEEGVQGAQNGTAAKTTGAGANGIGGTNGPPVNSGTTATNTSRTIPAAASSKGHSLGERGYAKSAPLNSKGLPLRPGENECTFYIKTGSCKYGATCRFNHPEIWKPDKRSGLQMPSQNHQSQNVMPYATGSFSSQMQPPSLGPQIPYATAEMKVNATQAVDGAYYQQWQCQPVQAETKPGGAILPICPHPQRPGDPDCSYYLKTGECSFGASCKFHHPPGRIPSIPRVAPKLTLAGLPRREGETMCAYYLKTGACKYGSTCRFDHPPPGEAAAKLAAEPAEAVKLETVDSEATETPEIQEPKQTNQASQPAKTMQYVDLNLPSKPDDEEEVKSEA